jgi:hypothetical protein
VHTGCVCGCTEIVIPLPSGRAVLAPEDEADESIKPMSVSRARMLAILAYSQAVSAFHPFQVREGAFADRRPRVRMTN